MVKTCVDSDDDDLEFEDAGKEEEQDQRNNDTSAFMVSRNNISKYQDTSMAHPTANILQGLDEVDENAEESNDEDEDDDDEDDK